MMHLYELVEGKPALLEEMIKLPAVCGARWTEVPTTYEMKGWPVCEACRLVAGLMEDSHYFYVR